MSHPPIGAYVQSASEASDASVSNQFVSDCVTHDVGIRTKAGFVEDARAVGAHGLDAEVEHEPDLSRRLPEREQAEDLEFTSGQPLMRLFHSAVLEVSCNLVRHDRRHVPTSS